MSTKTDTFPKKLDLIISRLVFDFRACYLTTRNQFLHLDVTYPGHRFWTRGDGRRYRDPGFITFHYHNKMSLKVYKAWERYLLNHPRARLIEGGIPGEFASEGNKPGVRISTVYIRFDSNLSYSFGSVSRLRSV